VAREARVQVLMDLRKRRTPRAKASGRGDERGFYAVATDRATLLASSQNPSRS